MRAVLNLEDFTDEVEQFVSTRWPRKSRTEDSIWGEGPDRVALNIVGNKDPDVDAQDCAAAREWRRELWDAGLGWVNGPEKYGGRGFPAAYDRAVRDVESAYDVPDPGYTRVGVSIVGPSIMALGTETAKQAYLPPIRRGDLIVCQLLSEPEAGSDLANVRTRAVRHGDDWILSGQKVWTSGAMHADVGECLAVTDPDAPRYKGLTMFMVDMRAPGVEVRPLRQMTGGAEFGEVFLDEVRVRGDDMLGDVGDGWAVTINTLMNERAALGDDLLPDDSLVQRMLDVARWSGADADPVKRQSFADVYVRMAVARFTADRILAAVAPGEVPGPELTIVKLALTDNLRRVAHAVEQALGPKIVTDTGEWGTYAWAEFLLGVPGMRIGGGTDEILRNTLAERVLGLPREPRPDRV